MNHNVCANYHRLILISGFLIFFIVLSVCLAGCTGTRQSSSTLTTQNTYSPVHNPGEKFVVTLPGANGGTTQAEIMMLGSYQSNYGEGKKGYSWYYNISIKNIGDRGIQLQMSESAEDNSGITAYIDQLYNGHQIVLHPGEEGTSFGGPPAISNKIYLLQSQKTPRGGGIYHLNLGGSIIDIKIPEM